MNAANDTASAARSAKITVWEIKSKARTVFGHTYEGTVTKGHHAEIVPGVSIRLFGLVEAGSRYVKGPEGKMVPCEAHVYRKDFKIGDEAEYHSYNLSYTGTITSITAKTVTVVEYYGTASAKAHRLDLSEFDRRNWNFDSAETAKRNSDTMQHI